MSDVNSTHNDLIAQGNTDGNQIQRVNGRFAKGVSGNPAGRPKGARNVLSKSVLGTYAKEAANGDFERVMAELKRDNPAVYAKLLNDAAMKEAERVGSTHGGLCEQCGGELESKTVLTVSFVDVPATHPVNQQANIMPTEQHASSVPVSQQATTMPTEQHASSVPTDQQATTMPTDEHTDT